MNYRKFNTKIIYSKNRLLTTIAYRIKGKTTYAMEGSIFIAGAGVQWLRDRMKFFKKAPETEKIIKSLNNNSDVYNIMNETQNTISRLMDLRPNQTFDIEQALDDT